MIMRTNQGNDVIEASTSSVAPTIIFGGSLVERETAATLENNQGDLPVGLEQVLRDLKVLSSEFGHNHLKVAETWNTLGLIRLHMQKDACSSIRCHEEALRIYRLRLSVMPANSDPCEDDDDYDVEHSVRSMQQCRIDVAVTLADLGRCHERLDDFDRALRLYKEALVYAASAATGKHAFVSAERAIARLTRR